MGFVALVIFILWILFVFVAASNKPDKGKWRKGSRESRLPLNEPYKGPEHWQLKEWSGSIFSYATEATSGRSTPLPAVPFLSIDFETTGITPPHRHRVVEVAVSLFSADGTLERNFESLINPQMKIPNAEIHGITDEMVQNAPTMTELLPYILGLMRGRLVVAHNAPFEAMFLFHEAQRLGLKLKSLPAVDTLSLARASLALPNHRLGTICRYFGVELKDAHTAQADCYATAQIYLKLIQHKKLTLNGNVQEDFPGVSIPSQPSRVLIRPPKPVKGKAGYISNLVASLPDHDLVCDSQAENGYLELLTKQLDDGVLSQDEAEQLAQYTASLGLSGKVVARLNQTFLESAYEAALSDKTISEEEARNLSKLAALVGRPNFFAGMPVPAEAADVSKSGATKKRRCGNCQEFGHTRRSCPKIESDK